MPKPGQLLSCGLFYGDGAPNLDRPQRVGTKHLFKYLLEREELEYQLASDEVDPLVPGGCYRAPPYSRWNIPEFTAVFADTLRKMAILTTTQHMWQQWGPVARRHQDNMQLKGVAL